MTSLLRAKGAVHIVLQGKGGVGKSLAAATLMQFLTQAHGSGAVRGFDTDPSNQTLAGYEALAARALPILAEGTSRVDEGKFDELVQWLLEDPAEAVIDTGATSFLPFSNYLIENDVLELLRREGRTIRIHTVVTGGQSLLDTADGFRSLAANLPPASMVVWLNEYFGPIAVDGRTFEQGKAYLEYADKVIGLVRWKMRNPDTFGRDMRQLLQRRMTFDQGIDSTDFNVVQRQRFKLMRDDLFAQLGQIADLSAEREVAAV